MKIKLRLGCPYPLHNLQPGVFQVFYHRDVPAYGHLVCPNERKNVGEPPCVHGFHLRGCAKGSTMDSRIILHPDGTFSLKRTSSDSVLVRPEGHPDNDEGVLTCKKPGGGSCHYFIKRSEIVWADPP